MHEMLEKKYYEAVTSLRLVTHGVTPFSPHKVMTFLVIVTPSPLARVRISNFQLMAYSVFL